MQNSSHSIGEELHGVLAFIAVIWGVFGVSLFFPQLNSFGVQPRTPVGLVGIAAAPFLHANLDHIASNTLPLFILLTLLAGSRARSWEIVVKVTLLGGLLLWLFGRSLAPDGEHHMVHIGASGLIFGLIAFLILSGVLEGRLVPLGIAVLVGFLYGSALLSGVLPRVGSNVSWDGHLCGVVAGGVVAFRLIERPERSGRD